MSEKSASFKKGKGNVEHNNREEKIERDNIDNERTKNNIQIGKKIDLREFYEQTFGQAVKDYNEKQTREDRKIGSYYDKISADSKKNLFYEIVIQIGDMHDTNCADNPEKEIALLEEYAKEFEIRNPTLKVFNAVIHLDEETPHLHLNYVPVAKNLTRGMSVQNSQTKALEQNINIVAAKKNFINEEKLKGKKSNPLIDKFFLEQERTHISKLMEKHLIKQKDKEEFKRGDLTVAQYKVAAKIADSLHNKILEKIEDVNLKFEKTKITGKKIITDEQIEYINQSINQKDMKIESNQLLIKALQKEIELAEEQKLEFSKRELSKKAVSQDLLIKKLRKDILEKEIELKKIKDTPNAALEIANNKIQKLELEAQKQKEQEEFKAKEYADKKPEREKRKELQLNKNDRLEKYDNHFIAEINKNATKLFDNQFEDFKKGSYLKKNDFEDFVENVINKLKEMYKEFADLFNYKALKGVECNLIEEEVYIVAEDYEEYKEKTDSRERQ